jgi:hypothetical protein
MTVAIRHPVVIGIDAGRARPPDPTVVRGVAPVAISVEIFGTPNVFIEVLRVVLQTLGKIFFAIEYPIIDCVVTACDKLPIAGVITSNYQLGCASIAQSEARRV